MDPFTIAAGIQAVGSLFKGVTGLIAGNHQAQALEYAAQQAEMEGGVNAGIALQQGDQVAAHAAAQAAANGGGLTGSAIGVIEQLSGQAMFNARAAAYRARTEAQADVYKAGVAKAQGRQALIGGVVDAGSSLVGGFMRSAAVGRQTRALATLRNAGGDIGPYDAPEY